MSINDKVKVIWKTNCKWRDCEHLAKRKEIKPTNVSVGKDEELATLPIKVGDPIRVKFASRWYDAEAAETWEPKTKKRGKSFVYID